MGSMSKKSVQTGVSRRTIMAAGLAGAGALAMPSILRAQDRPLKVGVYGGYFKDSFDGHIFPAFTKATGIAVESVAEPKAEAGLAPPGNAAPAGQAPAAVSLQAPRPLRKGRADKRESGRDGTEG